MRLHTERVERFYEEIWNRHDKSWIPRLIHEDFSFRGSLGDEKRGHEGFADYLDAVHAALGDYHCAIEETVSEGEKVFARMLFSGRHKGELFGHPPSGKVVSWAGAAVFTFSGELIRDLWVLGDVHGLLQQLE